MALMREKFNNLDDALVHELRDLYDAEHRLIEALPLMAEAAKSPELRSAFHEHHQQTEEHLRRLEEVFRRLGQEPKRQTCHGMEGIIDESQTALKASGSDSVRDAALIGAAQKSEHYEMAGYGTARAWAQHLGHAEVAQVLQQTLDEEGETDQKLTDLAESSVNIRANREH